MVSLGKYIAKLENEFFAAMERVPNDDPFHFAARVLEQAKAGIFNVNVIEVDGVRVGFTAWEVVHDEFVSVATWISPAHEKLREQIEDLLINLAKKAGCRAIRMETTRPGLVRAALSHGYRVSEVTLRKAI